MVVPPPKNLLQTLHFVADSYSNAKRLVLKRDHTPVYTVIRHSRSLICSSKYDVTITLDAPLGSSRPCANITFPANGRVLGIGLPEFGHSLLLKRDVNALGPYYTFETDKDKQWIWTHTVRDGARKGSWKLQNVETEEIRALLKVGQHRTASLRFVGGREGTPREWETLVVATVMAASKHEKMLEGL